LATTGTAINASPVAASMIEVSLSKRFIALQVNGRRSLRTACRADTWSGG
jgi:hypothetical protein